MKGEDRENLRYISTRGEAPVLGFEDVLLGGPARDGGLYMQIESISLTRSIPNGFGWVIKPFVESVPRESLEFTLRSTTDALRKH